MTLTARFQYKCTHCDDMHEGFPAIHFAEPSYFFDIPEDEREKRCWKNSELCVIDGEYFFVRCVLEYAIQDSSEIMAWGVWGSLNRENFLAYKNYCNAGCEHPLGPFFSWLSNRLPPEEYPTRTSVPCEMHISPGTQRPRLIVQQCDHPIWQEQQHGIPFAKALRIASPFISWHSTS